MYINLIVRFATNSQKAEGNAEKRRRAGRMTAARLCETAFRKKSAWMRSPQERGNLRSGGMGFARDGAQAFEIVQNDMPAFAGDHAFFLKTGKDAADGFLRDAQIVADVVARHAQIEPGGGIVAHGETP